MPGGQNVSGSRTVTQMPAQATPRYCQAKRADGQQCRKAPLTGGTLCRNHFGATGVQKRNQAKRLELQRARVALQKVGVDDEAGVDPRAALLKAVTVSSQMLEAVLEMMRALDEADINAIGAMAVPGFANTARGARAEAFIQLVGDWTDRSARVSKAAIDAGLDERMVHLAERQSELLVQVVMAALAEANVGADVQAPFLRALAQKMRLFSQPTLIDLPTAAEEARAREAGLPYEQAAGARRVTPEPAASSAPPPQDTDE